jgi:hypothetical protein
MRYNKTKFIYIILKDADFMPTGVAAHRVPSVGFEDHMHSVY